MWTLEFASSRGKFRLIRKRQRRNFVVGNERMRKMGLTVTALYDPRGHWPPPTYLTDNKRRVMYTNLPTTLLASL
jgi:hypothetical protein